MIMKKVDLSFIFDNIILEIHICILQEKDKALVNSVLFTKIYPEWLSDLTM